MATGEIKWSSQGKTVTRFERTPLPKGDYDLKFNEKDISQEKGERPGQVPYISARLEALGTATSDGGKNRILFARFFLHLEPSPRDGKCMVERQAGILDLSKALGEEISFNGILVPYQKYNAAGEREGEMRRIPIADPAAVLKWLKSKDGAVVKAHVKVKRASGGYDASNEIEYFIPSEETEESDEEYSMDESSEEEAVEETDELTAEDESEASPEAEEEEEEEEDLTATFNKKSKALKPAPTNVKQGPAGKGKRK